MIDDLPHPTSEVITRFAPSPTGFLHIGGARTALFNWLYAKAKGGRFLLRIEDTDRERSQPAAIEAILDGLRWLQLDWDGEPVYQFARAARHREIAEGLLAKGLAYHCYCTPDELTKMREQARADGRSSLYDGTWRDRDSKDAPAGVAPTIRFKAPLTGDTLLADQVQGRIVFPNADLDDLIILRSNGTPTYNLSVVVDDHDMGITHAIRGVDHLTNAARQILLYQALGWQPPTFAHVPLIHGADGAKLSKRHGALGVEAYRAMGYLPAAVRNYLVRLGWSHGDGEFFSTDDLIRLFDLPGIGRSPARFDFAKLGDVNAHYLRQMDDELLLQTLRQALPELDGLAELSNSMKEAHWSQLARALPGLKTRAKTLIDIFDTAGFVFASRPLKLNDKATKLIDAVALQHLAALKPRLDAIALWEEPAIEGVVRDYAEEEDLKFGKLAQPLRAALTGSTVSPSIFEVMYALGREETIGRLVDMLNH